MENSPESKTWIRFKDCDPLGHLYNTRFIEYMLEAREDQVLEIYGLNLMDYAEQRKMAWVIIKHEISFLKEAKRGEHVIIKTGIIQTTPKSIIVEYQMWNEDKTQLKAVLWTRFLHVDLMSMRSNPHPVDIQELLESINISIPNTSLDERIKNLMSM